MDNGMSDVAGVKVDCAINMPGIRADTVALECNGTIWLSNDGLGRFEGCGFAFLSNVFDKRSAASSVSFPLPTSLARSFISLLIALGTIAVSVHSGVGRVNEMGVSVPSTVVLACDLTISASRMTAM
jgi:hypothetical protein